MDNRTAVMHLRYLMMTGFISARDKTLVVSGNPKVICLEDVESAFESIFSTIALSRVHSQKIYSITSTSNSVTVTMPQRLMDRIIKIIGNEPDQRLKKPPVDPEFTPVLPSIFIGNEKTQVRQIPLVDGPPYPFRFLLELGGMIVLKRPKDPVSVTMALRQFLNNHPQYRPRIAVHECPDDTVVLYTYYIETVMSRREARQNLNVPEKGQYIE